MYRLTSEQQRIVDQVKEIGEKCIAPYAASVDESARFPAEAIEALGQKGFLGLTIPPDYGGMGQGLRVTCAVLEEIARCCASTAMVYLMHVAGIACYKNASDKFVTYLGAAAKGKHLCTLAWSERGSRSQFWSPVSRALSHNGAVKITAEKSFVTSAAEANAYVVSTQSSKANSPADTVMYLVLREDEGVKVVGRWNALGMRGNGSAPMSFDGVLIPPERALCSEGDGLQVMLNVVLPLFQVGNAAISVGIAEAAVTSMRRHLTGTRFENTNTMLAELPNLRARLAEMRIATDTAKAHLVSVLDAIENPQDTTLVMVLEAKAAASNAALVVTEHAMRIGGGAAFSKRLDVERLFRDAHASNIMAPTTDHAHDFIGRTLCGMEVF